LCSEPLDREGREWDLALRSLRLRRHKPELPADALDRLDDPHSRTVKVDIAPPKAEHFATASAGRTGDQDGNLPGSPDSGLDEREQLLRGGRDELRGARRRRPSRPYWVL